MANYDTVRLGTIFRENSILLLEETSNGDGLLVDLLVKGDVIYLFDCQSKALLKEILIMRDFSVETGTQPNSIILRDQTKKVILQANSESSKKNCMDNLQRLASNIPSSMASTPDKKIDYTEQPVTVVFRRPPPCFMNTPTSPATKHKTGPPPLKAPKPTNVSMTLPRSKTQNSGCSNSDSKGMVPIGTVKALSKDLARVLFKNPAPIEKNSMLPSPLPIPKTKANVVQKEEIYEAFAPPRQPSRIPSDPIMEGEKIMGAQEEKPDLAFGKSNSDACTTTKKPDKPIDLYKDDEHSYDNQEHLKNVLRMAPKANEADDLTCQDNDADMYASNIEIRRPWLMYGHPTRQDAAKAVQGKNDGAFVVRSREGSDAKIFPYALTVLFKDQPIHMQIQRTENTGEFVLAPWKPGEKAFETLDDLVQYYRDNRIAFAYHSVQGFVSLQKGNFSYD